MGLTRISPSMLEGFIENKGSWVLQQAYGGLGNPDGLANDVGLSDGSSAKSVGQLDSPVPVLSGTFNFNDYMTTGNWYIAPGVILTNGPTVGVNEEGLPEFDITKGGFLSSVAYDTYVIHTYKLANEVVFFHRVRNNSVWSAWSSDTGSSSGGSSTPSTPSISFDYKQVEWEVTEAISAGSTITFPVDSDMYYLVGSGALHITYDGITLSPSFYSEVGTVGEASASFVTNIPFSVGQKIYVWANNITYVQS